MEEPAEVTLRVRNMPAFLTKRQKHEFLTCYGAADVFEVASSSKKRSTLFATFVSQAIADEALHRLHQLKIFDAVLCVEYARPETVAHGVPLVERSQPSESMERNDHYRKYVRQVNAFNRTTGFNQPPPVHMCYEYPVANRGTINNIAYALDCIPHFYYQVLHLMNRMNLPPPFVNLDVAKAAAVVVQQQQHQQLLMKRMPVSKPKSDSESELESDEKESSLPPDAPLVKRVKLRSPPKQLLRMKLARPRCPVQAMTNANKEKLSRVFDQIEIKKPERIAVNVAADALQKTCDSDKNVEIITMAREEMLAEARSPIISDKELAANRLPQHELHVLPVFKNYQPGVPSAKLYIKNIAKTVTCDDLQRIYKRYDGESFDIKLMTEGRMKGQAFVTLDSVELSEKALAETNGYILKDKPLVVVFANAAKKK